MKTVVSVDGKVLRPDEPAIPVMDHGFLFGDSVYEALWWHRGVGIQEDDHLARLEESARLLYMDLQVSREDLSAAIRRTVEAAGVTEREDAYVRIVVTRGVGPMGLDFSRVPRRSVVVIVAQAERPSPEVFERGLSIAVVGRRRNSARALDPAAKTGNYLNNLLALAEAKRAGADDALMLNDSGEVTEASTSNVYVVADGVVRTPPLAAGILRGTTRTRILDLCRRHGIAAREESLAAEDLARAEEVFLSSSVRGVIPVTRVDGRPVGKGVPGPLTRRVHRLFEDAADAEAAARGSEVRAGAERHPA
jgi:branched-chain amino acid aminotransferase